MNKKILSILFLAFFAATLHANCIPSCKEPTDENSENMIYLLSDDDEKSTDHECRSPHYPKDPYRNICDSPHCPHGK